MRNRKPPDQSRPDPRQTALSILQAVFADGQRLDQALAIRQMGQLAARDRAFVRLLTGAVLRHHGQLSAILKQQLDRPPKGKVWLVLMLGAAQLFVLDTPAHAVVDTSVRLMRAAGQPRLAGLANAVLRRLAENKSGLWQATCAADNLPEKLRASWSGRWGAARTEQLCQLFQTPPPLDISVREAPEKWAERLGGTWLYGNSLRCQFDGEVTAMPGFAEGAWWVQDAAASLPVWLLDQLLGGLADKQLLDLCAAPGGKTAQLAAGGATVQAVEIDPQRADRLADNLARLELTAEIIEADILDWQPAELKDAILLDAPCSASGTIRRRPDLLVGRDFADLDRMARLQGQLLARACDWLVAGGVLVYVTCSMEAEEGEAVIADFLARPDCPAQLVDLAAEIPAEAAGDFADCLQLAAADKAHPLPRGGLRVMPDCLAGGNDGFFIACLRHKGT
jgi:16S rRNA (cytosine967-C5)-methyltransferase